MALGVGSVTDAPTAASYLNCGADFVVGPCFVEEVARLCNRRVVPYVPGCGTVAEIVAAQEAGCNLVKLFPAGCAGGPSFVKSVRGPLPRVQIMATGAVEPTEESLRAWFEAGRQMPLCSRGDPELPAEMTVPLSENSKNHRI